MTKRDNLLWWSVKQLGILLAATVALAIMLYALFVLDNGTWLYVPNAEDQAKGIVLGLWMVGLLGLLWLFLILKEILRRRNFDLDTVRNENSDEALHLWIFKQAIVSIALIVVILGSSFIFVTMGYFSLDEYITTFRSEWIAMPLTLAILFVMQVIGEIIKRQWRKRKHPKHKPSHLA